MPFVFAACIFMFAFSLIAGVIVRKKEGKREKLSFDPIPLLSGLVIGFYSSVNLILAGKLDSMIYYPIANGGAMLLTVLVSAIVFKERFDRMRMIGVGLGLLGILCLSIPV